MRFHVIHRGQKWARPNNHLDGRVCPECRVTVHGATGQSGHILWHDQLNDWLTKAHTRGVDGLLTKLAAAAGLFEPDCDETGYSWTAVVENSRDELEAGNG